MFSREYVSALTGVLEMEPSEAEVLEQELQRNPNVWTRRLRLLAYAMRGDQWPRAGSRQRRARHVLWLIEHRPDSEILSSPYGHLEAGVLTAEQETRAVRLWEIALQAHPSQASVFWNAAQFFRERNGEASLRWMRHAAALAPDNRHYGRGLGERLGWQAVTALRAGDRTAADRALGELERTGNPALLEPAVRMLQSEDNSSLMLNQERPIFGEKAGQLFARLEKLNPEVDRAWVMPQIKPEMIGMLTRVAPREDPAERTARLNRTARRLGAEAFPQLPRALAGVLKVRGCSIPQPDKKGPGRNVVRGEFFRKGEPRWAVLCSAAGKSSILVFRNAGDGAPHQIAESADSAYLVDTGDGWTSYSREIRAVNRNFIVGHYRAYGGPEPPPITHHGVDDAFLEKASITWYFHEGKWMQLQGSD
jgi:hypothetical protein